MTTYLALARSARGNIFIGVFTPFEIFIGVKGELCLVIGAGWWVG